MLPKATRQTSMVEQSEVCYLSFLGHDTGRSECIWVGVEAARTCSHLSTSDVCLVREVTVVKLCICGFSLNSLLQCHATVS